jgi:competence protein ComEC
MILVYLAVAWVAGIWLAHQLFTLGLLDCRTPAPILAAAAGVALALALAVRRRPAVRWAAVLGAMMLLGGWRYLAQPFAPCFSPTDLAFYNGTESRPARAVLEGVILGYPDVRDTRTFYRLRVESVSTGAGAHAVRGDVLVQAPRYPEFAYGDRIRASGQLQTPPVFDDFDYAAYLSARGIHSLLRRGRIELIDHDRGSRFWAILYALRARGAALLDRVLPEPAAALANGMLLGIESGIPPQVDEAFKATGTTHVIVISGSNIALLTGVLMGLMARVIGKGRAPWPTAVLVGLYVLLVGADPAAMRAGLMGILYVIAIALGRASTAYVSLCFSAMIMTLVNPLNLWDIGFQLSFAATLGLILFTPSLQARVTRFLERRLPLEHAGRVMGFLNDALIVTLAAQVLTLPLIIYYFGRLSVISLLANLLILPAQPPIMFGGMITLVLGLLVEWVGRVTAVVPWLFLSYTVAVVHMLAAAPLASVETGAAGKAVALLYLFGLAIAAGLRRWPRLLRELPAPRKLAAWAAAVIGPAWLIFAVIGLQPDGRLHLAFIPGPDGEAVLITTPGGRQVWIWDGQGDGAALVAATRPLLRGWPVGPDLAIQPEGAELWPGVRGVDPAHVPAGGGVRLGAGVELVRLAAGDGWLLRYGEFSTLLPPALPLAAQDAWAQAGAGRAALTLLKTPAANTGAWPTVAFLDATRPQLVLWPQETTYPPDVTEWLDRQGASRISGEGTVVVVGDGERIWLRQMSAGGRR